jgi:hypothetical protein
MNDKNLVINLSEEEKKELTKPGKVTMVADTRTMLDVLSDAVTNPKIGIDVVERLMAVVEKQEVKIAEMAFNRAMNAAQAEMVPIIANKKGQQNNYATYDQVDRALRPIYTRHGFNLSFNTEEGHDQTEVKVIAYLSHEDGYSRVYSVHMPADGKGPQGNSVMSRTHATASAYSYGKRYLQDLIWNLAIIKDDDGVAAAGQQAPISQQQEATLRDLIEENNLDMDKFLQACKIDHLSEMPVSKYPGAITRVNKAIRRHQNANS